METIHKLRDRTGAISSTVSKLFRRKNFKRKSKEFKDTVVVNDGGKYAFVYMHIQVHTYLHTDRQTDMHTNLYTYIRGFDKNFSSEPD